MAVRPNNPKYIHTPSTYEINPDTMTAAKRLKSAEFVQACEDKGIAPTKRQASKYNAGVGRWA